MTTKRFLRIGDVTARTGLTERALRHYEQEGLIAPERSEAGQRLYSSTELSALASIDVLRRAGFSLAEIRRLRSGGGADLRTLLTAQIEALRLEQARSLAAIETLQTFIARLDDGAGADVDLLCDLVANGAACEPTAAWRAVFDRYFNAEQQARWVDLQARLRKAVDPDLYDRAWTDLASDIKRALPLDPASPAAQAFLDRWQELLAPFRAAASQTEQREAASFWSKAGEWSGEVGAAVNGEVVALIMAAKQARAKSEGEDHGETRTDRA